MKVDCPGLFPIQSIVFSYSFKRKKTYSQIYEFVNQVRILQQSAPRMMVSSISTSTGR